jgi:hypothetical protein
MVENTSSAARSLREARVAADVDEENRHLALVGCEVVAAFQTSGNRAGYVTAQGLLHLSRTTRDFLCSEAQQLARCGIGEGAEQRQVGGGEDVAGSLRAEAEERFQRVAAPQRQHQYGTDTSERRRIGATCATRQASPTRYFERPRALPQRAGQLGIDRVRRRNGAAVGEDRRERRRRSPVDDAGIGPNERIESLTQTMQQLFGLAATRGQDHLP